MIIIDLHVALTTLFELVLSSTRILGTALTTGPGPQNCHTVCRYGDSLRAGWRNIMECVVAAVPAGPAAACRAGHGG